MDAFTTHTGTAAPLRRTNVDTDQIIPAEYLKRITRTGFEDGLFVAWRTNDPDFVLNQPQYADASVLVAGPDFGTGSSREHAVWALLDGGFRAVISSRFADIFRNNSTKSGLLTVTLPQPDVEALWAAVEADPTTQVTVDLRAKQVTYGSTTVPFEIDDYTRWRLLEGLDDVGLTERHLDDITAFEAARPAWLPKALPADPGRGPGVPTPA
jgi:3-isopropylmalate/(R)-2-methylmalate dehydratase small subunit